MTYKRKIWAKINAAAAEISWLLVKAAVLRSSLPGKCLWNSMPQVGNAGFLFKCVASSPDWDKTNDITMTSSGLFSQSSLQSHSRQGTHCFHALLVTNMWKKRWSAPLKKFTFPGRKAGQANQLIKTKNRVCFEIALVSGSSWCWCYNNLLNLEFPLKFPPSRDAKVTEFTLYDTVAELCSIHSDTIKRFWRTATGLSSSVWGLRGGCWRCVERIGWETFYSAD